MIERMAEIVWSDAASGKSPKASWHMTYVTPASATWLLSACRTVDGDSTTQKPSSKACSNELGSFGGRGRFRVRDRKVNVSNQRACIGGSGQSMCLNVGLGNHHNANHAKQRHILRWSRDAVRAVRVGDCANRATLSDASDVNRSFGGPSGRFRFRRLILQRRIGLPDG